MSILNPKEFAETCTQGFDLKNLAQVGLDIPVHELHLLDNTSPSRVNDKKRKFAKRSIVEPIEGEYILYPGRYYEWVSKVRVKMPENIAGLVVARSSMLRAGVFVTAGVFDPGYEGSIGGFLWLHNGIVAIGENERVAQFLPIQASSCQLYNGVYQGSALTMDAKIKE